jgi:ribose 5-phosphate isomerase B
MKQNLISYVEQLGHETVDVGTDSSRPVDYPDFAEALSKVVTTAGADRGILICGSGIGASVVANKVPGIRAGICHDTYSAHQGVEHDDMNVIVLGARIIGPELASEIVRSFLEARFSGEPRHVRRLNKVKAIERRYMA